jgi:hypothetical protein
MLSFTVATLTQIWRKKFNSLTLYAHTYIMTEISVCICEYTSTSEVLEKQVQNICNDYNKWKSHNKFIQYPFTVHNIT